MATFAFEPKTDRGAVAALLKALVFFACADGFQWAIWGPLRLEYQDLIDKALKPVFEYGAFAFLGSVVTCVFLLLLTWVFLSLVEKRSLLDIGLGRVQRSQFWRGALAGFLPGLFLAVPLAASRLAELYSSPTHLLQGSLWMVVGTLNMTLLACGYGLQVLWRRFGAIVAVSVAAFASIVQPALSHPKQWTSVDLSLYLSGLILVYVLMSWAFSLGRSAWLPMGLYAGLSLAPTGGLVVSIYWSYEKAHELWSSNLWSLQIGVPHIAILAAVALLIWRLNSGDDSYSASAPKPLTDFYVSSWAVGCGLGLLLILQWVLKLFQHPDPESLASNNYVLAVALLLCLYATTVFCLWLHKSWTAIQDTATPITPGQAVGLLFVPFYNLYWGFRALPGFATQYNRYVERHSLRLPVMSSGIYTLYMVLCLVWIVPFLGVVAAPAAYIVCILMMRSTCSAVNNLTLAQSAVKIVRTIKGVAGQVLSWRFEIPAVGMVIGSTPGMSHAVLSLPHVGASHARLWADAEGAGLWVQDLESGEGTFCSPANGTGSQWSRIAQPTLLAPGARLRFGSNAAEFEIA